MYGGIHIVYGIHGTFRPFSIFHPLHLLTVQHSWIAVCLRHMCGPFNTDVLIKNDDVQRRMEHSVHANEERERLRQVASQSLLSNIVRVRSIFVWAIAFEMLLDCVDPSQVAKFCWIFEEVKPTFLKLNNV